VGPKVTSNYYSQPGPQPAMPGGYRTTAPPRNLKT